MGIEEIKELISKRYYTARKNSAVYKDNNECMYAYYQGQESVLSGLLYSIDKWENGNV